MILKNGIFFYLYIILISLYLYNASSIIFPFKKLSSPYLIGYRSDKNNFNNSSKESYNSTQFFNDHYLFKFLTLIQIGSPPKNLISQLELYQDSFIIKNFPEVNFEIFNEIKNKGYQYKDSKTFKNLSNIINTNTNNDNNNNNELNICEDDLFLFTNINDIKQNKYTYFQNIKFELKYTNPNLNNNNIYNSLYFGLSLDTDNSLTNFIRQIYSKKIISSLIISFEYDINININIKETSKEYDGLIILGNYPHQIMPEKYSEEDLISFYSNQPNKMFITNFFISLDEISSINKEMTKYIFDNKRAILQLNSDLILGTVEYLSFIEKNFFGKYYELNICNKYITKTNFISDFMIISCEISPKLNLREFPNLYFYMKTENLKFEFTYEDLFMNIKNKYYFLIVFETNNLIWHIGKPLFSKYTFVYNGEAKTIGFYKNKKINSNDIKDNKKENVKLEINIGKIILFCAIFIVFIFLIIFISFRFGKKYNNIRKKFANELDDDNYEYNPKTKNEKDINGVEFNNKEKVLELINKTKDIM